VKKRRFAATAFADNGNHFALLDGEMKIPQNLLFPKLFTDRVQSKK
jgi:hypothetical protein